LLAGMTQQATLSAPAAIYSRTRHLERIADHATNIAEDIIFGARLDVRHGRGLSLALSVRRQSDSEFADQAAEAPAPLASPKPPTSSRIHTRLMPV